jgi:uncharacterized protein (DUF2164 family)
MGKSSRLRMLGLDYYNKIKRIKDAKKEVETRLRNISDSATYEARINTNNFIAWWIGIYPEEYQRIKDDAKLNKNKKHNVTTTLKRMKEWKESLKYT